LRTAIQKEYRILGVSDTSHDKLVSVEAQVGNLCNLKCLMCDETQSSVILQENIRLGINQVDQKEFTWLETGYQNLEELINQDLKVLNFRGGEPLYNKKIKNFLEKFPKDRANKVLLHLITNATVWDNSWEEILSKFKLVRMMLSIDAVSDCYEYIRFPASWENVNSNVQSIIKLPNVKPIVHCTVQNLNILYLDDLIKWCVDHGIYIEFNMLVYPQHLRPTNLPKRSIEHALNKLKAVESICTPNLVDSNLSSILNILQQSLDLDSDTALWQEFENKVTMRDQIRGNSYKNILTDN
jgi:MoaA/NifB/PqqE/SkfB family radical SAM enzyme